MMDWTVLRCPPQVMIREAERLPVRGYCPMFTKWDRPPRTRSPRMCRAPAYPGYIFAQGAPSQLHPLHPRVRFLRSGTEIVRVTPQVVGMMEEAERMWVLAAEAARAARSPQLPPVLLPGDRVLMSGGWLHGRQASVVSRPDHRGVELQVDGLPARVYVDPTMVSRVA